MTWERENALREMAEFTLFFLTYQWLFVPKKLLSYAQDLRIRTR